ncbi:hypothetical protein [Hafnia alvei]|uniref:hypothetical protein n=1 Tax=Hafnia alvei TaxID=569 RepID=UPI00062230B2|nr:hypothetical protein [Hafnia alvei]KKI45223.1 hypothetical protein XK86_09105 [Hafnia alvei]MDU7480805.1 hypothetical protein [Hafnia alvei]
MKHLKVIIGSLILAISASTSAADSRGYPGFDSEYICNGYSVAEGVIDIVTATQLYKGSYGVYIRLKGDDGGLYGGQIYERSSTDYAYNHMVNISNISYITKAKVKICYNDSDVYSIGLMP